MNQWPRAVCINLAVLVLAAGALTQKQTEARKTTAPQKPTSSTREFGKSYATLRPEQRRLVDDYVGRYNQTTGSKIVAQTAYDGARMSARTTFDAVTHALVTSKITDAQGKSLGHALDLVDAVDEVMGAEEGAGGDRQFRLYVYLKPTAFDTLSRSSEFHRDRDNTVYHKGFPTCFRLKNGPPSIQISMSRDRRMADIDVDYRSSTFPKALFNGHLTASNSDVRAGNNLDRHDGRWKGLNGWWRDVFGFSLDSGGKAPKDAPRTGTVPVTPRVKSSDGIDATAHDFLKSWIVDRQPNNAIAYFSRRSYPCLEEMAHRNRKPIAPGMVRVRLRIAMEKFVESAGTVNSVAEAFEVAQNWSPELKEVKNAYPGEFRLVSVPPDMGRDQECFAIRDEDAGKSKEKYYATAFRGKQGDSQNKVMSLLWAEEGKYWKIVAIRIDDGSNEGIIPKKTAAASPVSEPEPEKIAGDPNAVKDITDFYQSWIGRRDAARAARYASQRSYQCMGAPSEAEKKLTPEARIRGGLDRPLKRIPPAPNLSEMMSSVQPVNELVRPVEQTNSKAFAIMAVPDQMAHSFQCQHRELPEKTVDLKPDDAKYGTYYLSASRLNLGEEESPALLLLWTKEKSHWMVIAWAVEVP